MTMPDLRAPAELHDARPAPRGGRDEAAHHTSHHLTQRQPARPPRVYHPPGTVRLPTSEETETTMANFGVRFTYPVALPRLAAPARSAGRGLAAHVGHLARGFFRLLDQAPFDLAWPPAVRGVSRHAWPVEGAPAQADTGDQGVAGSNLADAPPALRRAA